VDPSGHAAYCGDDYDPGCLDNEEYAQYVQMDGEDVRINIESENASLDKKKGDTLPDPSSIAEEDLLNWYEEHLARKETPLIGASISVLVIDGIPIITGLTGGIGLEDLPLALVLFIMSRISAVDGLVSTYYQYRNDLHGTQAIDVIETTATTILGSIPPLTIPSVHINLWYVAYRYFGGELPSSFP
jgi:hypothetical protein